MNLDRYGTLVTVSSLLFIVAYAKGEYDSWDLLISSIATYFGISYLRKPEPKDNFELLMGSLITCGGALIAATSIYSIFAFYSSQNLKPLSHWDDEPLSIMFVLIATSTLVNFFVCKSKNS